MNVKRVEVTKLPAKTSDLRSYTDAHQLVDFLNMREPMGVKNLKAKEREWERRFLKRCQENTGRAIELLREINATTAKEGSYPWPPRAAQLSAELTRICEPLQRLRWRLGVERGRYFLDQTWHGNENYGLLLVASLSQHGLEWVRRCACGKWFLAYSGRNRFHSDKCRQAFWAEHLKTPEGRERRRLYMQKLRALKKERESKRREKR